MEIPQLVNDLKSVTRGNIRSKVQVYWKNVLCNQSYFMASCGGVTVSVLRKHTPND